jgi:putative PIN family toxin of toxin-antitoxin system
MRVVIDTNVLVSATWWLGNARELLWRGLAGDLEIILSDEILVEYQTVMRRKKFNFIDRDWIKRFTRVVVSQFLVLDVKQQVRLVSDDPSDDKVLACAKAARADLIVSGDAHLLALGRWAGIRVVSPREAIDILDRADGK